MPVKMIRVTAEMMKDVGVSVYKPTICWIQHFQKFLYFNTLSILFLAL